MLATTRSSGRVGWSAPLAVLAAGAVLIELLAAAIVMTTISRGNPVGDWVSFYAAGTIVRQGEGSLLFDAARQAAVQESVFQRELVANGYPLPAFVACIFAPLTLLSFVQTYWIWFAANVAMLGVLGTWAWRELNAVSSRLRLVLVGAAAFSTPVVYVLVLGQIDLFVAGAIVGSFTLIRRDKPFPAGCLLALAIAKPHLVAAAVLLLLVKREWRALAGFTAVAAPLLLAPMLAFGPQILLDQARLLFAYPSSSTDHNVAAAMMVNVRGLMVSVTGSSSIWLWLPALTVIAVTATAAAVHTWRTTDIKAAQAWAIALTLPLLYSPHAHIQNLVLLVCAAILFAAERHRPARPISTELVLSALVLLVGLWLLSIAGIALLGIVPAAAFILWTRSWPAMPAIDQDSARTEPDGAVLRAA